MKCEKFSNLRNTSIQIGNMDDSGNSMEFYYRDNSLRVNSSGGEAFATYGNMYSTLFHENYHARLLSGTSGTGKIEVPLGELGEERKAYEAQMRDSSFLNTTMGYRIMTIQYYHNVLEQLNRRSPGSYSFSTRAFMIREVCNRSGVDSAEIIIYDGV